jgi:putative protease
MKETGKVTHYYGKIGVAIIELSGALKVGEKIKIQGKHGEFEQPVDSIQIEHETVQQAKAKDVVGVKVAQKVDEGSVVSLVEE